MGEGECEPLAEDQPKKSRHRKKHLFNLILHQMEFYFSDSNLTKDRYLSQLLAKDPYIDIEEFLKFNKIKKLNCTIEDIQKAIRKSDIIELSEDGGKIHRKRPIRIKENVDLCTVYVENIKGDATHDTLSQIFSDFGNVMYVSIPKYKHNKANKGFAFIEYETEEQAKEAITFFESIGCKISSEKKPEELRSIITFEGVESKVTKEEKTKDNADNKNEEDEPSTAKVDNTEDNNGDNKNEKRKLSTEDNDANKKLKTDHKTVVNEVKPSKGTDSEKEPLNNSKKRKLSSDDVDDNKKPKTDNEANSNQVENLEEIDCKKKKNKKEKRKNYIKELGMQVLTKLEWKKMRNHYLDLQRKKMKEFKQYLNRQKFGQKNNDKKRNYDGKESVNENKEVDEVVMEVNKLGYTPGVIVKLNLPEPCMDLKKLKNEIKSLSPEVKYVDVPLPAGSEEVFIRFSTSDAAKNFCEKEFNGEKVIIEGEEEESYWDKIKNDRTVKFQKANKKLRGREKLLRKAEKETAKHLRFDENDL